MPKIRKVAKVPKVLVIDDDPKFRAMVRAMLLGAGFAVCEASNGEEGIAVFRKESPQTILIDILMPQKEGIETIRELRAVEGCPAIIAMSGGGQINNTEILVLAKKLGAHAVLKKPFRMQELIELIKSTCAGSS